MNPIFELDFKEIEQLPLPWTELKGSKILLTGATGFIGKYLVEMLTGVNVKKHLEMEFGLFRRRSAPESLQCSDVHWIAGDITEEFLPEDFKPNIIIHAASPANTKAHICDPVGLPQTNILATRYLLECARKHGATFVYFSSAAVYLNRSGNFSEVSPGELVKNNPTFSLYGASKLAGELLCEDYRRNFGVDCRVIRPFNIHGPGESLDSGRYFPDFLRQALRDKEITVTGTGTPVRDSCYLMDFVSGLLYVLLKGNSTTYNIGNEDNVYTILEIARKIAEQSGGLNVIGPLSLTDHTSGDFLVPDTTKLRRLGWHPQVDVQECIKRCLDSYRYADS